MMFSQPCDQYVCDESVLWALNPVLILHADQEQNCSTSTVRMVGSSRANLFASCAAGVSAQLGGLSGAGQRGAAMPRSAFLPRLSGLPPRGGRHLPYKHGHPEQTAL
jgi:citrate synthase